MLKNSTIRYLSWAIAILGVWEVIAPWVLGYSYLSGAVINAEIVGGVFIIFGTWSALSSNYGIPTALNWLNAFFGAWLALAPFFIRFALFSVVAEINAILIGVAVVILGLWAAITSMILARNASQFPVNTHPVMKREEKKQSENKQKAIPVTGSEENIDDGNIKSTIKDRLNQDKRVDASDIDVLVHKGAVTLKGRVTTHEEKHLVEDDAHNVKGVKKVKDRLHVAS